MLEYWNVGFILCDVYQHKNLWGSELWVEKISIEGSRS
jgi:hypothetical protein